MPAKKSTVSSKKTAKGGGGHATAGGIDFQAKVGAIFAASLLGETPLAGLPTSSGIRSVRFETEAPLDDILVETREGFIFTQAKTTLGLAKGASGVLNKVADQIVRQWLACVNGDSSRGWNRPLRAEHDALLVAISPSSPAAVTRDLIQGLQARASSNAAKLSNKAQGAVDTFLDALRRAWKSVTGNPLGDDDLHRILQVLYVKVFDSDGADATLAASMLRHIVEPGVATTAYGTLAEICQSLMKRRSGADAAGFRKALTLSGLDLDAPVSFRDDVEKLRAYSSQTAGQLADYESILVAGETVRVDRRCTQVAADAARGGSFLVVGEPGAGKSAVVNGAAKELRAAGCDVIVIAVDRVPARDTGQLSAELGIKHPLTEVLRNWPGTEPAYLFIDALDATRGGENEGIFRALIADALFIGEGRWHVIASIRSFDLRLGERFRRLFRGDPPNDEFSDPAFGDVAHLHIPLWTSEELDQLLAKAPALAKAVGSGGERLRDLALVPFNTRLLADLITSGAEAAAFNEIRTQVQLLSLYWNRRVQAHGTVAELCLRATVKEMVEGRGLRARKLTIAEGHADAFDALLRENVLVLSANELFASFRHHILFDYAASRVYLNADRVQDTAALLSRTSGLGLMLGPALGFSLQHAWADGPTGQAPFWQVIIHLAGDGEVDPVARSVAARTASELPHHAEDTSGFLACIKAPSPRDTAFKALTHVVGALVVRLEDKHTVAFAPWTALARGLADLMPESAWQMRSLLYAISGHVKDASDRELLGIAARSLLAHCLDQASASQLMTSAAIEFVIGTYASDVAASRALIRRIFEVERFQKRADQEVPQIAHNIKSIFKADPDFVAEIYRVVFGGSIEDDAKTNMGGSQILSLTSNRRQDYQGAWWSLKEFYPKFLEGNPAAAGKALIAAVDGYLAREHPIDEDAQSWTVSTSVGDVRLREDRSHIWAWNLDDRGDTAHGLLKAFVEFLEIAEDAVAAAFVDQMVRENDFAVIWSRMFLAAGKRPQLLGLQLWPVATQLEFITCFDTQKDAIDLIAATYPHANPSQRRAFEERALTVEFPKSSEPSECKEKYLARLFASIGLDVLETEAAIAFVPEIPDGHEIDLNPRPFKVTTEWGRPDDWWWLREKGVKLDEPEISRILKLAETLKNDLGLDKRDQEVADFGATIARLRDTFDVIRKSAARREVTAEAFATVAQGCAKLARQLGKQAAAAADVSVLVELVVELAGLPADPWSAKAQASFEKSPSWGGPDIQVEIAEAVVTLCRQGGRALETLRAVLENLLQVQNPAARMQVAERLSALWDVDREWMWKLADQVASTETNRGLLKFFANYFFHAVVHADPERVERLAFTLYERPLDHGDEPGQSLVGELGTTISLLWISHGRERARRQLETWVSDPHTFEEELTHAINVSRGALVLKYTDVRKGNVAITDRTQNFYRQAVNAMATGLEAYLAGLKGRAPSEKERDHGSLYAQILDRLMDQIFFASGAFRAREDDSEKGLETVETKRRFLDDMQGTLTRIADAGTPNTIHHLLEVLEHLIPADPARIFDLVSHALLGAGQQHNYQHESMGVDRFVGIVGRFLADYRELFTNELRRKNLVACLEVFMDAGWPSARRLLYRLPDLLQ